MQQVNIIVPTEHLCKQIKMKNSLRKLFRLYGSQNIKKKCKMKTNHNKF